LESPDRRDADTISTVLAVGAPLFLIAVATAQAAPAPTAAAPTAAAIPLRSRRTTTVVVGVDVGAPLERAVPSAAYEHAAAADAEERWDDAQPLYRQAIGEWTAVAHTRPSRALELAIEKAERELRASQVLAISARGARLPDRGGRMAEEARRAFERHQALEDGRLLSAKLLATRAALGRVSTALYVHTRNRLEAARDADPQPTGRADPQPARGADPRPAGRGPDGSRSEAELLLCVTYAAGDAETEARFARAQVMQAEREDPANTLAVAACAAALGETDAALRALEIFALRPVPLRPERFLRDVYLSNEWDRLRGDPRFETLFPQ
jgi:hypothetical protein